MNRAIIVGATVVAVAAAAAMAWQYPVYRIERAVRAFLKDPDSAQFQRVQAFYSTGGGCGFVNAKNALGGYVGYTHFVMKPSGEVEFEPADSTDTGSTEQRLEATSKRVAYLQTVLAACPEPEKAKQ